jgi:hypothetical protein
MAIETSITMKVVWTIEFNISESVVVSFLLAAAGAADRRTASSATSLMVSMGETLACA